MWHHTFVNIDETQPLKGFGKDAFLHVTMSPAPPTKMQVKAQFVSNKGEDVFLNDVIDSREHPCHLKGMYASFV